MTEASSREVNLYTPNKKYIGLIDIQNEEMRTLDLLNSSNIFWKNPNSKSSNDSIMLNDVTVMVQGDRKLSTFSKLQLRLADIIFFSDSLNKTGSTTEVKRAETLSQKSNEKESRVKIITRMRGDTFYIIVGVFFGLFKNKTQQRFMPITRSKVREVIRTGTDWETNDINVGNHFIGLSTYHIEACSMEE